jgi:hypothetical protein
LSGSVIGPTFNQIGIDGGFVKVCLNVVEENKSVLDKCSSLAANAKDTGVKRLFLSIIPGMLENYENMSLLLSSSNIKNLVFLFACDLKVTNIIVGIQSASSTFPCPWWEGKAQWVEEAQLRTIGRIKQLASKHSEAGKHTGKAKEYFNCVNPPLLNGVDNATVLSLVPPPELHLLLGVTNTIFKHLNKQWEEDRAYKWAEQQKIMRVNYRGGSFEGNHCRKLLCNADMLESVLSQHLKQFATAFKKFDAVVKSCFGLELQSNYKNDITAFEQAYRALDDPNDKTRRVAMTPKVHITCHHVPHYCEGKQKALSIFSEQATESPHHDFKSVWERPCYNRPLGHPGYAHHLKRTTVFL